MRPYTIALVGIKGGAGKTALATAMASEWVARGFSVVIVDLDPVQRSADDWRANAIAAGNEEHAPAVVRMRAGFSAQLDKVGATHDFVLLDCPGGLSKASLEALGVADLALLPCGPAAVEIRAMEKSLKQVYEVRARRPKLDAAVVITRRDPRTVAGREIREVLREGSKLDVLKSDLEESQEYDHAYKVGLGPSTWKPSSPRAQELREFVSEVFTRLRGVRRGQ